MVEGLFGNHLVFFGIVLVLLVDGVVVAVCGGWEFFHFVFEIFLHVDKSEDFVLIVVLKVETGVKAHRVVEV